MNRLLGLLALIAGCPTQEDVEAAYERGFAAGKTEVQESTAVTLGETKGTLIATQGELEQCRTDLAQAKAQPSKPKGAWNVVMVDGTCDIWYRGMTQAQCDTKRDHLNNKHGSKFMCWHDRAIREGLLKYCRKEGGMLPH